VSLSMFTLCRRTRPTSSMSLDEEPKVATNWDLSTFFNDNSQNCIIQVCVSTLLYR
jgi:hypothetical protein